MARAMICDNCLYMQIELYWDDLTEKAQNEIRDILGLEPDDNNNWDYIPMAIMEFEGEEQPEEGDPH